MVFGYHHGTIFLCTVLTLITDFGEDAAVTALLVVFFSSAASHLLLYLAGKFFPATWVVSLTKCGAGSALCPQRLLGVAT